MGSLQKVVIKLGYILELRIVEPWLSWLSA